MGKLKTQESTADTSIDNTFNRTVHVLHVDDDIGLLSTAKQILELQNPFRVEVVSTVREAMQKVAEQSFDVIVSDYQMPEKDGLTFLKELRENGCDVPFILFTGKGREEVAIKALNIGADYYINKLGHPETVYPQLSHYIFQAVNKRKAEKRLIYQLEFESVISRVSSRLVNPPDFDAAINQSLEEIGQLSNACRAYLFMLCENETVLRNTHEWCNNGVEPQIENCQNLSCEIYSWWMKKLHNNEIIHFPDVHLMPPEAKAEKELILSQDIKSFLVLPVNVAGKLAGFIGFDNVINIGFWSSEDVTLLQIVAEIIGNSLERKQTYEKLKENEHTYRLLTENITDVIFIQDMNLKITYVSPSVKTLAGYTPEEVYQLNLTEFMTPESIDRGIEDFKESLALITEKPGAEISLKQYEYIRKDGTTFWGELKTKILFDSEGKPVGLQGTLRDIDERKKTEEKLKASEEKHRLLTENTIDVVFVQDLNLKIKYASPSVEALTGYTPEEVMKLKPEEYLAPESFELAHCNWAKAIASGDKTSDTDTRLMQYEYVRKDGSTFWGELKVKILWDSNGCLLGTQGILRDITERKNIEEKLKQSEEKYRLLTENITDVVFIQNLDLSIRYASPSVEVLCGYTPEEVKNLGPRGLMTPESFERGVVEIQADLALAAQNPDYEPPFRCYEYIRKDGSRGWGEFKPKLLRDSEGNILAMQGTLRDVTERKKAEDALRQEQEKLELITGTLKAGLGIISKDFKVLWANKFLYDCCGDILGKTCYEVFNDLGTVCPNCGVKEVFETGKEHSVCEQSVPYGNGKRGWVELTVNPIRDEKGEIVAASELSVIIDDRKKMEKRLLDAEKKYRFLFDKAPVGIAIVDLKGKIVEFNDKAHLQLGYSREEFAEMYVDQIEVLSTKAQKLERVEAVRKSGIFEFETKHLAKNGELRDVKISVQLLEFDGNPFLYSILKNITEQKNAHAQLKESEENFRLLAEQSPNMIFINQKGKIVYINPKCVELMGYTKEEFYSPDFNFLDLVAPEFTDYVVSNFSKHKKGEDVIPSVYTIVTKSGKKIEAILNTKLIPYNGDYAILGTITDITERKKVENKLRETLIAMEIANEKLSVVGRLTRHDVRNKLSVIANNIYLAKQQLAYSKDVTQNFDAIDSAIDQIERIFSFARTYEQLGLEELSYINIKNCVGEAVSLFSGIDRVKFVVVCAGLTVFADSLLRQIFYNLIDDSLKHGEKVSRIKVYCENETDYLKLIYEDDGIGIPENEKELVFKEGYGKDTGYGLYLIRKICEAYGWSIEETGTFGNGVKFVITIPKFDDNSLLYRNQTD